MISIIYSVIILLSIGVFGYLLANYLNKDVRNLEMEARRRVRNKLLERKPKDLDFSEIGVNEKNRSNAKRMIQLLM